MPIMKRASDDSKLPSLASLESRGKRIAVQRSEGSISPNATDLPKLPINSFEKGGTEKRSFFPLSRPIDKVTPFI